MSIYITHTHFPLLFLSHTHLQHSPFPSSSHTHKHTCTHLHFYKHTHLYTHTHMNGVFSKTKCLCNMCRLFGLNSGGFSDWCDKQIILPVNQPQKISLSLSLSPSLSLSLSPSLSLSLSLFFLLSSPSVFLSIPLCLLLHLSGCEMSCTSMRYQTFFQHVGFT